MKIFVWLILCLIWGTTWLFIKVGLVDLPPITFAATRFILAVLILVPLIVGLKFQLPNTRDQWKLIALTGFLQFSINYSLVFWSEQYITSGLAAVLQAMITVFGLLLAWIFLPDERITKRKIAAVIIGILGVAGDLYRSTQDRESACIYWLRGDRYRRVRCRDGLDTC
jgi:drug/metabolite transporter (DMT)-like permease